MKNNAKTSKRESLLGRIFKDALAGDTSILNSISTDSIPDGDTKRYLLELKKEFNKMVEKRKRFLSKHFPLKPLSISNASIVDKLLIERFQEKDYGEDATHRARKLWQDFVKTASPQIKDTKPWVAAIEYIFGSIEHQRLNDQRIITPKYVAQESGIPFNQLNLCYRNITKSINTNRYFSSDDHIDNLHQMMKSIFRIAKKFRGSISKEEFEGIKAQEAWFDNIYAYSLMLRSGKTKHGNKAKM